MSKHSFLTNNISRFAWALAMVVCLLAVVVWGQSYNWKFSILNAYTFFPLIGLLAFSIMWSHYISGALRVYLNLPSAVLKNYFDNTSILVLALLLLHPGLLLLQRFLDGFGLPPGSYISYVAPGLGWIVTLGAISLVAFLMFELRHFFSERSWWKYVMVLNDLAMLAIFYHGLQLGSQLQISWYRAVWYFFGVTLLAAIVYGNISRYSLSESNRLNS